MQKMFEYSDNSIHITPFELLKLLLDKAENGSLRAKCMYVIVQDEHDDASFYSANLLKRDVLWLLKMAELELFEE